MAGGAPGGRVRGVGQHPGLRTLAPEPLQDLRPGGEPASPVVPLGVPLAGELLQLIEGDAASGSGDDHGRAHFVDVHPGLHRQDADVEDVSVPPFQLAGAGEQVAQVPREMGAVRRGHQGGHLGRGAGEGARVQG